MAGTPLATAFVRVRMLVDQSQVKSDVDKSLSGASASAKKEGEKAGKDFGGSFGSSLKGLLGGGVALLGLGGVVEGFKSVIEEGSKLQRSTEILTAAEKSHGLAVAANAPIVKDAIEQGAKYGLTQDTVQDSLVKLINAGVPLNEALKVQQAAINASAVTGGDYSTMLAKMVQGGGTAARTLKALGVTQVTGADQAKAEAAASKILTDQISSAGGMAQFAAARHLSLADAQKLVSGALKGNIGDFNKLNIEVLPKSATLAQNLAQAQSILNSKYGAEGLAATRTFAGEQAQLRAKMQDLAGTIGLAVLPYLTEFVKKISDCVTWMQGSSGAAQGLRAAFGGLKGVLVDTAGLLGKVVGYLTGGSTTARILSGALVGLGAGIAILKGIALATDAWKWAQLQLDAAMDANPVGILILAVAALAGAFYEAWKRSSTFRDIIKDIGVVVLQMGIVAISGLKLLVNAVLGFFGTIVHGAASAFGWVPGLGPKLKTAAKSFDDFRSGVDSSFDSMLGKMKGWQDGLQKNNSTSAAMTAKIVADFKAQGKATTDAKTDLDKYTSSVSYHSVASDAARAARTRLYNNLVASGVKSAVAKTDLDAYTAAVDQHGKHSDQARDARLRLIADILAASKNATAGKTDTDALTTAIQKHGTTSDAYRQARAKLIADLIGAGQSAQGATSLVDGLTTAVKDVPGSKTVYVYVQGQGAWSITQGSLQQKLTAGTKFSVAAGGIMPGYQPGVDSIPALLSPGKGSSSRRRSARSAPTRSWRSTAGTRRCGPGNPPPPAPSRGTRAAASPGPGTSGRSPRGSAPSTATPSPTGSTR